MIEFFPFRMSNCNSLDNIMSGLMSKVTFLSECPGRYFCPAVLDIYITCPWGQLVRMSLTFLSKCPLGHFCLAVLDQMSAQNSVATFLAGCWFCLNVLDDTFLT